MLAFQLRWSYSDENMKGHELCCMLMFVGLGVKFNTN
jgi:hypothetical protein